MVVWQGIEPFQQRFMHTAFTGNFTIEQKVFNNLVVGVQNYYSLRLLVGLEATF